MTLKSGGNVLHGTGYYSALNPVLNANLFFANRNNQIPSSVVTAGMANLDARSAGRTFKGCYLSYSNNPWSAHSVAFFVDTVNGFSVLSETYWAE